MGRHLTTSQSKVDSIPERHTSDSSAYELLNRAYFERQRSLGSNGIAETPAEVVDLMVREALGLVVESNSKDVRDIRWLDPCAGTGAFPLGIIEEHLLRVEVATYDHLPMLTTIEVDAEAIEIMLSRLDEKLSLYGLSVDGYRACERLQTIQGDFFEYVRDASLLGGLNEKFDIVIGNPPYLKSRFIAGRTREIIDEVAPRGYTRSADLYVHFYAAGWKLVSNFGVLCYVTPHNFLKSPSCRWMRELITQNGRLTLVVDFGERPIFTGISVHSGIFAIMKDGQGREVSLIDLSIHQGTFDYNEVDNCSRQTIGLGISADSKWIVDRTSAGTPSSTSFTPTLEEVGYSIYSGIRTGLTAAYLLDDLDHSQHPLKDDPSVYKIVLPTHIGTSPIATPRSSIINLPRGCAEPSEAVLQHLRPFKNQLEERSEFQTLNQWYEQRSLAYLDKMKRRKIAFADIGVSPKFAIVEQDVLIADGAYFIDSDDLAILALLRSTYASNYFRSHSPTIGSTSARGRLRLKKHVVKSFPMPPRWRPDSDFANQLRILMTEVINQSPAAERACALIDQIVRHEYDIGAKTK